MDLDASAGVVIITTSKRPRKVWLKLIYLQIYHYMGNELANTEEIQKGYVKIITEQAVVFEIQYI